MPLMFNIDDNSRLGDAAALYRPGDFYVPMRFFLDFPQAIAFVMLKTDPRKLRPIFSVREAEALACPNDKEKVVAYLTDEQQRRELEPSYIGTWVSEALRAEVK